MGHTDGLLPCRMKLAPQEPWKHTPDHDHLDTDSRDEAPTCYTGPCRGWQDSRLPSPGQATCLAKQASFWHQQAHH